MMSKQYPYEVNVLSKKVNLLREGRQLLPVGRVNFFRMDRQMLKKQGVKGVNHIQEKTGKDKQKATKRQNDKTTNALFGILFLGVSFLILYIYYNIYII